MPNLLTTFYSVTNYKPCRGRQGTGFWADLFFGGRVVAHVYNYADGGICIFHWTARTATQRNNDELVFLGIVKKLDQWEFEGEKFDHDADSAMSMLVEKFLAERKTKKQAKRRIAA